MEEQTEWLLQHPWLQSTGSETDSDDTILYSLDEIRLP